MAREFTETDISMLRKLEMIRQHFREFDSEFRLLECSFINSWFYEGKAIEDRNEFDHLIKGDLTEYRKPIEYPTEFDGQKVYQIDEWTGAFDGQFKIGDLFTVEFAEHFLECVPPKCWSSVFVQCGEPHDHRQGKDGKYHGTYATFECVKGTINDTESVWRYCGSCFKGEHEEFRG